MVDKTFEFKGKTFDITGSQELIDFISDLHTTYGETNARLEGQPSLSTQLALWEKAKPYYEANKRKVDYDLAPLDVQKQVLKDAGYDIEDIDEKTTGYLFNKVLPQYTVPEPEQQTQTQNTTPATSKPKTNVVAIKPTGNGMTSEELAHTLSQRRLEGSIRA